MAQGMRFTKCDAVDRLGCAVLKSTPTMATAVSESQRSLLFPLIDIRTRYLPRIPPSIISRVSVIAFDI